jgi:regulator of sigma E protease
MPSPTELRARGKDAASAHAISERLYLAAREGRPFQVRVERDGTERDVVLQAQPAPEAERPILGVAPVENHVIDLRSSPLVDRTGLEKDDRLLDVNGVPILRSLDLYHALAQASEKPRMRVVRDGTVVELAQPSLNGEDAAALADDIALAMDQAGTRVRVYPGSAAEEAGLEDGDRILRIDGSPMNRYKDIQIAAQGADRDHPLTLSIERRTDSGSPVFREITVSPRAWHQMWTGLGVNQAEYIYKADGPLAALRVGVRASWKFMEDSWLTLKRILFGHVSSDNVGGIITIGVVSHSMASAGLAKLFFFLCMLSMNLAFLNVLPIPMLDGGHLFFLLIEKLKGSPVSERVLGYSQMVGIVLILSLMVFATFNDVRRWIFS